MTATPDLFGLRGQLLDGQFRVDEAVGEGAFSVVYRGWHLGLDAPVAIKCLKCVNAFGIGMVDTFVERFKDEGRLYYKLSQGNLNIVRSLASGTTQARSSGEPVPFMVLEWLEGMTLGTFLDAGQSGGERDLADVVRLLDSAADGLAYAHSQGVVHRDLNPGNIFIVNTKGDVRTKVLDFGVAKVFGDQAREMGVRAPTLGQLRIFSPAYGAPEQYADEFGSVGPWTDVYAFATIFVEALFGRPLVCGDDIAPYMAVALDEGTRPTPRAFGMSVPSEVEQVFARALAIRAKDRWSDAGEFWGALKNAIRVSKEEAYRIVANETPSLAARPQSSAGPSTRARGVSAMIADALGATQLDPNMNPILSVPSSAAPPASMTKPAVTLPHGVSGQHNTYGSRPPNVHIVNPDEPPDSVTNRFQVPVPPAPSSSRSSLDDTIRDLRPPEYDEGHVKSTTPEGRAPSTPLNRTVAMANPLGRPTGPQSHVAPGNTAGAGPLNRTLAIPQMAPRQGPPTNGTADGSGRHSAPEGTGRHSAAGPLSIPQPSYDAPVHETAPTGRRWVLLVIAGVLLFATVFAVVYWMRMREIGHRVGIVEGGDDTSASPVIGAPITFV